MCRSRWPGSCASGPTSSPKTSAADADTILVAAAVAGTNLPDLAELYGEIYEQSQPASPNQDKDEVFDDRSVRLNTTFAGPASCRET